MYIEKSTNQRREKYSGISHTIPAATNAASIATRFSTQSPPVSLTLYLFQTHCDCSWQICSIREGEGATKRREKLCCVRQLRCLLPKIFQQRSFFFQQAVENLNSEITEENMSCQKISQFGVLVLDVNGFPFQANFSRTRQWGRSSFGIWGSKSKSRGDCNFGAKISSPMTISVFQVLHTSTVQKKDVPWKTLHNNIHVNTRIHSLYPETLGRHSTLDTRSVHAHPLHSGNQQCSHYSAQLLVWHDRQTPCIEFFSARWNTILVSF